MRFTDSPERPGDIDELRGHLHTEALERSAAVRDALERFGEDPHAVHVFAYDEDGSLSGGLVGSLTHGWLTIGAIWVRQPRLGLGTNLLERAEARVREAGADAILARIWDFQSPEFYKRRGFRPSGAVRDRPTGATELTLVKRLTVDATVDDAALHPPKRESFDTAATVNIDPKGVARPVDEFRDEPFGLYMARPADHPQFDYLESWLLPRMHLRATRFRFTPGHERDQRVYLDVARVWREGAVWHTEDWYLDLVEHPGRPIELVDVDELLEAAAAGLVSITDAETAIRVAAEASSGITLHGHSVDAWLAASGAPVAWHS